LKPDRFTGSRCDPYQQLILGRNEIVFVYNRVEIFGHYYQRQICILKASLKSPRRSLLFTPGDSLHKIEKAAQLGVDTIILDLEDAVSFEQKENARQHVVSALTNIDFGKTERLVRVNAPDTYPFAADLDAVAGGIPDGIVIPKVETAVHIHTVDKQLSAAEQANGRSPGTIRLFALIETALGIMNIKEIAQASQRLDGLLFGAEDLVVDLGATRSTDRWEIFHARTAVVLAAAAYRLQAIDMVYVALHDLAGLEAEASFARQLGYTGKMAIHPRQVSVINRSFSPTEAEIDQAQRLVAAYQSHVAAGSGVFLINGRMVDRPMIRAAEHLLERARLCNLFDE
jgi:citrate lyase beta subunit